MELASAIRERRITLGLSIDEAAAKAGVGAKSWSRYEAGGAIRHDKARGVCRALGWSRLPGSETEAEPAEDNWLRDIDDDHEAWSEAINELYGRACATTFAVGSDLTLDHLSDDLKALAKEPRGTHLGQLPVSWFDGDLPEQFVPRYDYDFVYELRASVHRLRLQFAHGNIVAHTVLEELALYLIFGHADLLADTSPALFDDDEDWREWLAGILGDLDVEFLLFTSHMALTPDFNYHFDHWNKAQFFLDEHAAAGTAVKADGSATVPSA